MTLHVTWSQIEAECGNYRAGFVDTFRKYEGRDTDEIAGNGQIVRVTVSSFARHTGIDRRTFGRWIEAADQEKGSESRRAEADAGTIRAAWSGARRMPVTEKARLAAELLADDEVAEQVVTDKRARQNVTRATDDYHQQQATERRERTERKAAADSTDRRVDSLLWVNRLGEACERFTRDGNEALRNVDNLPDSERYWLTGAIDRAEATARAARRYLELGKSEFNAELEALLDGGV